VADRTGTAWLLGHFPPMRVVMTAHAKPEELRAVGRDTLAEARCLGVPVPRLEAADPYFTAETRASWSLRGRS
jgi:2-dehydropantoate 2-reductase